MRYFVFVDAYNENPVSHKYVVAKGSEYFTKKSVKNISSNKIFIGESAVISVNPKINIIIVWV